MLVKVNVLIATAIAALLLVGVSQAKSPILEKSFEVKSGGTLYLRSDSGSIQVESHSGNLVEIEVQIKGDDADDFAVEFSKDGNDVRVVGEREGGFFSHDHRVRFIVKIPKSYNVDLETGGGSIDLSDLKGSVDAHTSGGSISLGRIEGDVEVDTSGGSITVEEVAGNIDAHTSGGSIKANISQQPTNDCHLKTSGGSVTVYLSPEIAVDLNASTNGGRVSSEFAVNGSFNKRRIKGTINGGGPMLELKTNGGSVRVKKS